MQENLIKVKKIATYFFTGLGILAAVYILAMILLGVGRSSFPSLTGSGYGIANPLGNIDIDKFSLGVEKGSGGKSASGNELTERKVVKDGSLSLLVKKAEEASSKIAEIAEDQGGFVSYSQIYEVKEGVKSGEVRVRVPADKFDETVGEIKKLAIKVEREAVNAKDVTEEYVDLEAQLRNLRAEEQQYLEIMKKAVRIEDILSVSQRLFDTRGRIERIQGQFQYLSRQVEMAAISIQLTAEPDVKIFGIYWRPLSVAKQSFRKMLSGLTGYADAMIGFVFGLPVFLLWLATGTVILVILGKLFNLVKKRFFPQV